MSNLVDRLNDRIEELTTLLGAGRDDVSKLRAAFNLKPQQAEILGFMLKRSVATRDAIYIMLFGCRPECDQPDIKIVDVHMVAIRRALKAVGIPIMIEWGIGSWSIAAADKVKIRSRMSLELAAAGESELQKRRRDFLYGANGAQ